MAIFTFPRQIYFQRDIVDSLDTILEDSEKILLITDKVIFNLFGERIIKTLKNKKLEIFKDVMPEPTVDSIEKSFLFYKDFQPDTIIALGGGSVIDFAKSMVIKFSYPEMDLRVVNPFEKLKLKNKLVAIPTTSGTGSDASFGIVLTDNDRKIALGNYDLVPEITILDSSLTPNSREIIRSTGIDALVHAFEALSANTSNILTDALSEKVIESIFNNLKKAMNNDENAKDIMHLSATMAGISFSNSGTALAHALGHSLGSTFHIVHGTAVGIFLPYVIEFNRKDENTNKKYEKIEKLLNTDNLENFIKSFYKEINQPLTIMELGIDKNTFINNLDQLVGKAIIDSELAFNPVIVGEEDIKNLFIKAYGD